jgi:hypothetical protein
MRINSNYSFFFLFFFVSRATTTFLDSGTVTTYLMSTFSCLPIVAEVEKSNTQALLNQLIYCAMYILIFLFRIV